MERVSDSYEDILVFTDSWVNFWSQLQEKKHCIQNEEKKLSFEITSYMKKENK
jgi:hypothetical protein